MTDGEEGEEGERGEDGDKEERRNKQVEAKNKSERGVRSRPTSRDTLETRRGRKKKKLIIAPFVSAAQILVTHPAPSLTVLAETEFCVFLRNNTDKGATFSGDWREKIITKRKKIKQVFKSLLRKKKEHRQQRVEQTR